MSEVDYILNKYKNKAMTNNIYYKPLKKLDESLTGIPKFRLKNYIVYINLNVDKNIRDDIKSIARNHKIISKEIYFLPKNSLACLVDKEKFNNLGGVIYE